MVVYSSTNKCKMMTITNLFVSQNGCLIIDIIVLLVDKKKKKSERFVKTEASTSNEMTFYVFQKMKDSIFYPFVLLFGDACCFMN